MGGTVVSRQTPFDTGERFEAKPWYPDRSDVDTYGKVDFEDDSGQTSFTIHVENKGGDRIVHIYDHDQGGYRIEADDTDLSFEVPTQWAEPATPPPPASVGYIVPPPYNPSELDEHSDLL